MALIDSDKLRALLDDFTEKEAVTREEINEIENQIKELEERIKLSRERLVEVSKDIERVDAMKNRYAEGDWSDVLSSARNGGSAAPEPALKVREPEVLEPVQKEIPEEIPEEVLPEPVPEPVLEAVVEPEPVPEPIPEPVPEPVSEIALETAPEVPAEPAVVEPVSEAPPVVPVAEAPAESLFSFSGPDGPPDLDQSDSPWGPPTVASAWDPPPSSAPSSAPAPAPEPVTNAAGVQQQQAQQQQVQQQQVQPLQPVQTQPQGGQSDVLSSAFDEEFDIAEALGGTKKSKKGEEGGQEDDNVKKINDALRGLFS